MHLLATSSTGLDDLLEPVDLKQPRGDVLILSFADSDLSGLAAAWALDPQTLPSVRLTHLRDLRHPMSVDLWIDRVGGHAKVIVARLLGGLDWWRYGAERLSVLARERGIVLALLPGEDRDDQRLEQASTVPVDELQRLLGYFREGGRDNLRALLQRLAHLAGAPPAGAAPVPVARAGAYRPEHGIVTLEALIATLTPSHKTVAILFYRALLLAADVAPIDALAHALEARGLNPAPLFIQSLRDADGAAFLATALRRLDPAIVITTTAFAAGTTGSIPTPLETLDVPVLQAVIATTKRAAWSESARGLGAADLAMHVVLPELDGRLLAATVAFKDPKPVAEALAFAPLINRPEPDRITLAADRAAALVRLQQTPRANRRLAILMPDDPRAGGRTGYAVGLDAPASVLALTRDLSATGYRLGPLPTSERQLLEVVMAGDSRARMPLDTYRQLIDRFPAAALDALQAAWGDPGEDPEVIDGAFSFRARVFDHVVVALPPDRGRSLDRRADYHDPLLPPRHALVAFALWLRHVARIDALIHMGAHGTLEWLPGKSVALSAACFPEVLVGSVPVFYPFIVSNPGEAAHAKRRLAAVTIGHLPPPLIEAGLCGALRTLEQLVDEYAQAEGLDPRRRDELTSRIVATARESGIAGAAGSDAGSDRQDALRRIDAYLCDLKDLRIKDGLHIYGRAPPESDLPRQQSAMAERAALLAALDGRRVAPGPAGAPARERPDVLPTGRNLFAADPRTLPTQTAMTFGRLAADEMLRTYLQTHGEMPRALVFDLWGSATLRTGGEEIAQGLALMGCEPIWDLATGRVTGVKVLPCGALGRSRVDVTWRISGLFRDLFPAQLALMDAAVRAVAAREESAADNPLAAALRAAPQGATLARIFGAAPGVYGTGIDDLIDPESAPAALGAAYLEATAYAYGGADGEGSSQPGAFADRIKAADGLVHPGDDPGRDVLEGAADVSFVGGFAAAAALLGCRPDLIMLDTTDPHRPRARTLSAALDRIVRARAVNPRYLASMMRHGPRGAAELAETVDRLLGFATTTDAVGSELIDLLFDSYVADRDVAAFLQRENPAAARAIAEALTRARRAGRWHPRRNDVETALDALKAGAGT
ncbi:MAG TPA: cobaltochelatase subunit CobN [Xanthobacteraceae bacterium]|nr:cobaltochelatase subunit CobN [Xanthobacteraceae bacterium]